MGIKGDRVGREGEVEGAREGGRAKSVVVEDGNRACVVQVVRVGGGGGCRGRGGRCGGEVRIYGGGRFLGGKRLMKGWCVLDGDRRGELIGREGGRAGRTKIVMGDVGWRERQWRRGIEGWR